MRLTVLGGSGAWPTADRPCSGYLVEQDGFRLLVDPGYATFPALQRHARADQVDAVVVTHGHPDHCVDLNPLLRARALSDHPPAPLPLYAPPGALDAVLALDRPGMLTEAYTLTDLTAGTRVRVGPFDLDTRELPHFVRNFGVRLVAGDSVLAYTGDTGPSDEVVALAERADLFVCEATHLEVPEDDAAHLTSAAQAGEYAARAEVGRLLLTHVWPGTDEDAAVADAGRAYGGPIGVAWPGLVLDLV